MLGFDSLTGGGALSSGGSNAEAGGNDSFGFSPQNEINFAKKNEWQTFAIIAIGLVVAVKLLKGK